jgi:hypothetical protein
MESSLMGDDLLLQASARRIELTQDEEIDSTLRTLLARYESVTADPRKMGYLRFLLRHYAGKAHPWRACYQDNFKRFGPRTKGLCGVLKDTIRQGTHWRGEHPKSDSGAPGVSIAFRDAPYAKLSVDDIPADVWAVLLDLDSQCDICRVLYGLDPAPDPSETFLSLELEGGHSSNQNKVFANKAKSTTAQDRNTSAPHLFDSALHHLGHAILHLERLAEPDVKASETSRRFNLQHATTHALEAQDHAVRMGKHLEKYPSDPKTWTEERERLKQMRCESEKEAA